MGHELSQADLDRIRHRVQEAIANEIHSTMYLVIPEKCVIRVYHGDLDRSYWQRGMTQGERIVGRVESVIRTATGLRRIKRRHIHQVVEFQLRKELFDRAAVAVRMTFTSPTDNKTHRFFKSILKRD